MTIKEFPFKTSINLKYLLEHWDSFIKSGSRAALAVQDDYEQIKKQNNWLMEPIESAPDKKKLEVMNFLFSIVFPELYKETDISGAVAPFIMTPIYGTEKFNTIIMKKLSEIYDNCEDCIIDDDYQKMLIAKAYGFILREFYNIDAIYIHPFVLDVQNSEGKDIVYDLHFDSQFVRIKSEKIPVLSESDLEYIKNNASDVDFLMSKLPPELITFEGFVLLTAHDITASEMLSRMRSDLIANNALNSDEVFLRLQENLRIFLGAKNMMIALKAITGGNIINVNLGCTGKNEKEHDDCVFSRSNRVPVKNYKGTIFEESVLTGRSIVITDLSKYRPKKESEMEVLDKFFKSCVIVPLSDESGPVGILILMSELINDFSPSTIMKLGEIIPLFTLAVKRAMDDFEIRIQAIIQEQFTAIHPSVQWRFRKAALNFIDQRNSGKEPVIENIIFDNVYPLYGQSDIKGSSTQRNLAIQNDLKKHMDLIMGILLKAKELNNLPVFDEMIFRLEKNLALIDGDLSSGDEIEIINYIRRDFEPYLESFSEQGTEVSKLIERYIELKDPEYGTIYEDRKRFDMSVGMINRAISVFLDREQVSAQDMFPHYFESQSTDGIDFSIYIGQSMAENRHFDRIYLKNLRLWQLIIMCKIARLSERLKTTLPLPLETTHLVVVQHLPITVGFHDDEKALHVEGAYNVRYEIMKKRIDKALIKGTSERLTSVGHIAIVYSQQEEAKEYREYIDYLRDRGYIEDGYEDLVLADLQGIHGLRAFRIKVNLSASAADGAVINEVLSAAG